MKKAVPSVEGKIPKEDVDDAESLIETNCNISSHVKRRREIMKSKETDSQKVAPSFNYGRKRKCQSPNKTIKSSEISFQKPGPSSNCVKKRKQNPIKTIKLSDKGCRKQSLSLNSTKKSKSQISVNESLNDMDDCDGMFPSSDCSKSLKTEDFFAEQVSIAEEDLIYRKKELIQRKQELEKSKASLELKYKTLNDTKEFIRNSGPDTGAFISNGLECALAACVSSEEDVVKMCENAVIEAEKDVEDAKIRLELTKERLNYIVKYVSSMGKEITDESDDDEEES